MLQKCHVFLLIVRVSNKNSTCFWVKTWGTSNCVSLCMLWRPPVHLSLKCSSWDLRMESQLEWKKAAAPLSLSLHCCSRSCRSIRPCRGTCGCWDLAWAPSGEAPGTLPDWTDPQTLCSGHWRGEKVLNMKLMYSQYNCASVTNCTLWRTNAKLNRCQHWMDRELAAMKLTLSVVCACQEEVAVWQVN